MPKLQLYLLLFFNIILNVSAQISLKKSSSYTFFKDIKFFLWAIAGAMFYGLSLIIYIVILKHLAISKVSPLLTVATTILVVLSGVFLFYEHLSYTQVIGIILGIISVIMLAL